MKRVIFFFIITALFLLGTWVVFFKFNKPAPSGSVKTRLQVVCTVGMITDVVKQIAGDHVDVIGLMGPGVDPHLYKAREGDVHKLFNADIILFNGLHLEGKMGDLFRSMKKKTVPVAEVIPKNKLIEANFQGAYDPHVWHDVQLWIEAVKEIKKQLIAFDQKHAQDYETNGKNYLQQLYELNAYVKSMSERLPVAQRILVTAHDAFNYFGKAYGFEVVGLQGISTDSEISTKDIQQLADFIVSKKVPAIFVESSLPQRNIEAVQRAVEARNYHVEIGPEIFSDALGCADTGADTYISMIKHNIDSITSALHGETHYE